MKQPALAALVLLATACHSETGSNQLTATVAARPTQSTPAEKDHISLDDYGYLRLGMLQNEAEEIMMTPGVERSSSHYDGSSMTLYEWDLGADGAVTLRFKDGKLVGKSQYGLR